MEDRHVHVSVSFGTVVKTACFGIFLWALYQLFDLVLVVLTAVVIASAIEPAAQWFISYRIPRVLGVIIIYLSTFILFFGVFYFFVPPFLQDLSGFANQLPERLDSIKFWGTDVSETVTNISPEALSETLPGAIPIRDALDNLVRGLNNISTNFFKVVSTVFGGVLSFVLIIVISFYLAVQERGIENFLSIITPVKYEKYVISLWHRSQKKIGLWLRGQLVLGLIVGVLVYLGLTIFNVKYALLLALIAAMFELIPIFGPILAAVPAVGLAFLEGGIGSAFMVVIIYVIIQQFENQLFYPLVVKQVVGVPSIIAIIALFSGAQLAGLLGMILSVPLAAILMELFNDLDKEKHNLRVRGLSI